jgi:putative transposase
VRPQEALRDLDRAYANYWRGRKASRRVGLPKFKKRGRCTERFRLTGAIRVQAGTVVLPRIGWVATKEPTGKFGGRILSATCSREADRWHVALTVAVERPDPVAVVGPVVGSTGASQGSRSAPTAPRPRAPRPWSAACAGCDGAPARSPGSSLARPTAAGRRLAVARLHRRIRNQRTDALHKATTALAKAKSVIVVEDLDVAGMIRNRRLARAISDQGWAEFHRRLTYKTTWYGSRLLVAPRFFPSSKTCSGCGLVTVELPLGVRVFSCQACGLVIDRDLNAARNLARLAEYGAGPVAASSAETRNACGGGALARPAAAWWNCPR